VLGSGCVIRYNGSVIAAYPPTGFGSASPADIPVVVDGHTCQLWAVGIVSIIIILRMATPLWRLAKLQVKAAVMAAVATIMGLRNRKF